MESGPGETLEPKQLISPSLFMCYMLACSESVSGFLNLVMTDILGQIILFFSGLSEVP